MKTYQFKLSGTHFQREQAVQADSPSQGRARIVRAFTEWERQNVDRVELVGVAGRWSRARKLKNRFIGEGFDMWLTLFGTGCIGYALYRCVAAAGAWWQAIPAGAFQ
jgi:hypothetical protein